MYLIFLGELVVWQNTKQGDEIRFWQMTYSTMDFLNAFISTREALSHASATKRLQGSKKNLKSSREFLHNICAGMLDACIIAGLPGDAKNEGKVAFPNTPISSAG